LHGFQQRGLRLGRRAVDFVSQDDVGEDGAFEEAELPLAGGAVFLDNLRAGDIRLETISVLARPGTPSRIAWPRAKMQIISSCSTCSWPTMALAISSRMVW